jgi:hypothetical protein
LHKPRLEEELKNANAETGAAMGKFGRYVKRTAGTCDQLDKIEKFGESAIALGRSVAPYVG